MTPERLERIRKVLERHSYWMPPDAVLAVEEGRTTYHPLDPTQTYELSGARRQNILNAMAEVDRGEDDPNYVHALNRLAAEELQLVGQEAAQARAPKSRKRGRK